MYPTFWIPGPSSDPLVIGSETITGDHPGTIVPCPGWQPGDLMFLFYTSYFHSTATDLTARPRWQFINGQINAGFTWDPATFPEGNQRFTHLWYCVLQEGDDAGVAFPSVGNTFWGAMKWCMRNVPADYPLQDFSYSGNSIPTSNTLLWIKNNNMPSNWAWYSGDESLAINCSASDFASFTAAGGTNLPKPISDYLFYDRARKPNWMVLLGNGNYAFTGATEPPQQYLEVDFWDPNGLGDVGAVGGFDFITGSKNDNYDMALGHNYWTDRPVNAAQGVSFVDCDAVGTSGFLEVTEVYPNVFQYVCLNGTYTERLPRFIYKEVTLAPGKHTLICYAGNGDSSTYTGAYQLMGIGKGSWAQATKVMRGYGAYNFWQRPYTAAVENGNNADIFIRGITGGTSTFNFVDNTAGQCYWVFLDVKTAGTYKIYSGFGNSFSAVPPAEGQGSIPSGYPDFQSTGSVARPAVKQTYLGIIPGWGCPDTNVVTTTTAVNQDAKFNQMKMSPFHSWSKSYTTYQSSDERTTLINLAFSDNSGKFPYYIPRNLTTPYKMDNGIYRQTGDKTVIEAVGPDYARNVVGGIVRGWNPGSKFGAPGKYYLEYKVVSAGAATTFFIFGIAAATYVDANEDILQYNGLFGTKQWGGLTDDDVFTEITARIRTSGADVDTGSGVGRRFIQGDVIGLAYDADTATVQTFLNGSLVASGVITGLIDVPVLSFTSTNNNTSNPSTEINTRGPFQYSPPTNHVAFDWKNAN